MTMSEKASNTSQDESLENTTESNVDGIVGGLTRRNVLKRAGILAGTTGVGLGSIGLAAAAMSCTGNGSYTEQTGYVRQTSDSAVKSNEDCSGTGLPPYYKLHHNAGIIYAGSAQINNSWHHMFILNAHSETFTLQGCSSSFSWQHDYGVEEHKAGISHSSSSAYSWPRSDGDLVKAAPPVGSGTSSSAWMDYAYTGLALIVGAESWTLGAAMSLAAVYVNNLPSPVSDSYNVSYDWNYGGPSSARECGSHFIRQPAIGAYGAAPEMYATYTDETWGRYPNYSSLSFDAYVRTPSSGTYSSSSTTSATTQSMGPTHPTSVSDSFQNAQLQPGDQILDSNGNNIKITEFNQEEITYQGGIRKEMKAGDLPPILGYDIKPDENVIYQEFPLTITKSKLIGEQTK